MNQGSEPTPGTRDDLGARVVYATDNSIYQRRPARVATPTGAAEVARLVLDTPPPTALVARGGGTGTNGQSLTDGLMIDTKVAMNRILALDPVARTATVEPGLVAGALDAAAAVHGLFWPPHTSTRTRATVGGMIATNAAGKGSARYGRTHRHVASIDLILADGTRWQARPLPRAEAEIEARRADRVGAIWQALLAIDADRDYRLPELARGFSGYGISGVHHDGLVDPIPVVCGSEGTLGIVVEAVVTLSPIPTAPILLVAGYAGFDDALTDSVRLSSTGPSAIEVSDETTLVRAQRSPMWPHLAEALGTRARAVAMVEYDNDTEAAAAAAVLAASGRAVGVKTVDDPVAQRAIWKVRDDAVGLLAAVGSGRPRPTAFVEDCAVPLTAMPEFIAGFRAILDAHGLDYAMFGHADVGCIHVRPALDPVSLEHERLVDAVTDAVTALLDHHGGILWGEHGRGLRSAVVEHFLEPETIAVMRSIKTAFDPQDRFNPGKLYRPLGVDTPLLGLADVGRRATADRAVPVSLRRDFATAFDCNGNGMCHHFAGTEVMCPSYKVTNDPVQSPKGRADLVRAWLAEPPSAELDEAVAASMQSCLACAACTGRCPTGVNIPELRSRFYETYYRRHRRPRSHALLARFESLAPVLGLLPRPVAATLAPGINRAGRLIGLVDVPLPARRSTPRRGRMSVADGTEVVLLPDVFSTVFDPDELHRACRALRAVGYRVEVAPLRDSGKFAHVKGARTRFIRAARRQQALVEAVTAGGAVAATIEPATGLLHHHDYRQVVADYPAEHVRAVGALLAERADRLAPAATPRRVYLFAHCTEQSLAPVWLDQWETVLRAVGHQVTRVATGCCGMAGIFGHETANQAMSHELFDRLWRPHLDAIGPGEVAVATGWSCRSQATRHGHHLVSPLAVLTE